MNKPLLALLLLCSCTREVSTPTNCYQCTTWISVTKPGCPPSADSATYVECGWTASDALRWEAGHTWTEHGVNGYRAESVTKCQLKSK